MGYIVPNSYSLKKYGAAFLLANNRQAQASDAQYRYEQQRRRWQRSMQGTINTAMKQYQTAYNSALEANESRYQELLENADTLSNQRSLDITNAYTQKGARDQQRLTNLGMANTTVAPTLAAGNERQRQTALTREGDEATRSRMGIIERRTDAYPDNTMLVGLMQSYGRYA